MNTETREVVNVIVADPATDRGPDGFELVEVPDGCTAGQRWLYSRDRNLFIPPAEGADVA